MTIIVIKGLEFVTIFIDAFVCFNLLRFFWGVMFVFGRVLGGLINVLFILFFYFFKIQQPNTTNIIIIIL